MSGPPPPSSDAASVRMRATGRRDSTAEVSVRRAVHRLGLRYLVDERPVPEFRRHADLVFRRAKVAVFVDGCFWHGCPRHCVWPRANARWWRAKIEQTRSRDADTNAKLRAAGWIVLRFWEHAEASRAADRISRVVAKRLG